MSEWQTELFKSRLICTRCSNWVVLEFTQNDRIVLPGSRFQVGLRHLDTHIPFRGQERKCLSVTVSSNLSRLMIRVSQAHGAEVVRGQSGLSCHCSRKPEKLLQCSLWKNKLSVMVADCSPPGEFERYESLWFEDGNIIIVAGQFGFRVYRGLPALRSPVFKDLFSLPQSEGAETMDGCAVVRLHDHPFKIAMFLQFVQDGCRVWDTEARFAGEEFWHLMGPILSMSHKYQCEILLEEGKTRLFKFLPGDIQSWDLLTRDPKMFDGPGYIAIANMARLLDMPLIHQRALYQCCQLSADLLVNGDVYSTFVDEQDKLCSQDLQACVEGRTKLAEESINLLLNRFKESSSTKKNHRRAADGARTVDGARCIDARVALASECLDLATDNINYNPLDQHPVFKTLPFMLCRPCAEEFIQRDIDSRQSILDRLWEILGLDPPPKSDPGDEGGSEASEAEMDAE
ncbi:hypothetical protein BXZ70DRAFT_720838 [Cristinia sonorae]|uniref:BTB domain-containing protein n=1 Tax=Cristinia sonorae TaxID=1940300 RepID=A0A8K0XS76_9AGAR|nr:hypothetical protein BXZ70DRAFT_720838 [Cristinia sonorae]